VVEINAYVSSQYCDFKPLALKRDWMDETFDRHAYHCYPVSIGNMLGWTISFPEDIEFIWDGISDSTPNHVTVHQGSRYVFTGRSNATISFNTGVTLQTSKNMSWLMMPVPNQFIEGVQCFTTVVSTSVLKNELPCAWKITTPNKRILIPANTPIAAFIPISLSDIQSHEINVYDPSDLGSEHFKFLEEYGKASLERSSTGDWTNFYRDAVDHLGNKLGEHELKNIRLKMHDHRKNYGQPN
jgi:hypothetical protein